MLRAITSVYIESLGISRRDVFKVFRVCAHSSSAGEQTVLSSTGVQKSNTREPSHATVASDSAGGAPPARPPRPLSALAALAAITASLGGVYLYRKRNGEVDDKKDLKVSSDQKGADAVEPAIPAGGEALPAHVQYLLVGGGTASFAAMRAIRSARPDAQVLIVGAESALPYMRPPLSKELWREPDLAARAASPDTLTFRQWNGRRRSVTYEPSAFYAPPERLRDVPRGHGRAAAARGGAARRGGGGALAGAARRARRGAPGRRAGRARPAHRGRRRRRLPGLRAGRGARRPPARARPEGGAGVPRGRPAGGRAAALPGRRRGAPAGGGWRGAAARGGGDGRAAGRGRRAAGAVVGRAAGRAAGGGVRGQRAGGAAGARVGAGAAPGAGRRAGERRAAGALGPVRGRRRGVLLRRGAGPAARGAPRPRGGVGPPGRREHGRAAAAQALPAPEHVLERPGAAARLRGDRHNRFHITDFRRLLCGRRQRRGDGGEGAERQRGSRGRGGGRGGGRGRGGGGGRGAALRARRGVLRARAARGGRAAVEPVQPHARRQAGPVEGAVRRPFRSCQIVFTTGGGLNYIY